MTTPCFKHFIHVKSQFRENESGFPLKYFCPGKRCYNTLLSNFRRIICEVMEYGRLKPKENFNFSSKSGRGRLTRFQIGGGGRLREVVAIGGLTVF